MFIELPRNMLGFVDLLIRKRKWIIAIVSKNIKKSYRNSLLGLTWLFLPSIVKVTVYYTVFSTILAGRIPGTDGSPGSFIRYLVVGILAWEAFSTAISSGTTMFVASRQTILGGYIQKSLVPIVFMLESMFSAFIIYLLMIALSLVLGVFNPYGMLQILIIIFLQQILAVSIAVVTATYRVYFDDVSHLVAVIIQTWFWVTPIVYPFQILPEIVKKVVETLNPFYYFIELYHKIFVFGSLDNGLEIGRVFVISACAVLIALILYSMNKLRVENLL